MNVFVTKRLPEARSLFLITLAAGFLVGNLLAYVLTAAVINPAKQRHAAEPYRYISLAAANGVTLHAMRTTADNIALKPIDVNVTRAGDFGINGGFFWEGHLLSIAVTNGKPAKGQPGDYGSGWFNIDVPKGTLVWDGGAKAFSVQVALQADELRVKDKSNYWAQGGISMSLGADGRWLAQAMAEQLPVLYEPRLRSGAVYDADGYVWLLVSDKPCTPDAFRQAVKEKVAPGRLIDGIFLDGDGSSQMRNAQVALRGDSRQVYQMMALRQK